MSVVKMEKAVEGASLSPKDRKWFVYWVSAYARFCRVGHGGSLPVDVGRVIAFLKAQKRRRRVAWQRLQAVRAIEFYCRHVPRQPADHLRDIHETLQKRAQTEAGGANDRPPIVEEDLVGRIDPNEPEILQAMRRRIRLGIIRGARSARTSAGSHGFSDNIGPGSAQSAGSTLIE